MTDDKEELELIDPEEIPDEAAVLQCGRVITSEGTIGRVDPEELHDLPEGLEEVSER